MLDKMPPALRHLVLMGLSAGFTAASEALPNAKLSPAVATLCGVAITMVLTILTPLTRQYGVGAPTE